VLAHIELRSLDATSLRRRHLAQRKRWVKQERYGYREAAKTNTVRQPGRALGELSGDALLGSDGKRPGTFRVELLEPSGAIGTKFLASAVMLCASPGAGWALIDSALARGDLDQGARRRT
jgi:hypothetical protein